MAIGRLFGMFGVFSPDLRSLWLTPTESCISVVVRALRSADRVGDSGAFTRSSSTPARRRRACPPGAVVGTACPITLFVSFSFGQFDSCRRRSCTWLYLLCRGRVLLGVLSVFGGSGLKNFPIVYLIIALPVIIGAYGPKRALGSVAILASPDLGDALAVSGARPDASYLAFKVREFRRHCLVVGQRQAKLDDQFLCCCC